MDSRLLDKPWRLSHLYSITGKDGGEKLQFKPNQAQQQLFSVLKEKKRVIVLKARQLGITTASSIWFLDDVLFRRNINSLSVLQSRDHAISAFDGKVHFAWNNLNQNLKAALGWSVDISRANQLSFAFGDGSSSSYVVSTSGRSGTFQNVHLSELAALCAERPNDAKEVITGTIPAVPNDGLILIESTAQGETGYFADYWRDAVTGKNGFHPLFFNWRWDKEEIEKMNPSILDCPSEFKDLAKVHSFTDKETAYLVAKWRSLGCDWSLLRQEYPTTPEEAFMSSSEKFFDTESIDEYLEVTDDPDRKGSLAIYQEPKNGRIYAIGADPSEGVGRDHSAAVVLEVDGVKPKVVATYADNECPPEDFAHILKMLSERYNSSVIAVERNNHGHAVLATLKHVYDEDLLYRQQDPSMVSGKSIRLGFNTNAATKPLILHALAQVIREKSILIPSRELLDELRMYPRSEATKARTEEGASRHWDLTLSFALALHCAEYALKNGKGGTMGGVTYVPTREHDEFSAI